LTISAACFLVSARKLAIGAPRNVISATGLRSSAASIATSAP
jgi:hypothetical protein